MKDLVDGNTNILGNNNSIKINNIIEESFFNEFIFEIEMALFHVNIENERKHNLKVSFNLLDTNYKRKITNIKENYKNLV